MLPGAKNQNNQTKTPELSYIQIQSTTQPCIHYKKVDVRLHIATLWLETANAEPVLSVIGSFDPSVKLHILCIFTLRITIKLIYKIHNF